MIRHAVAGEELAEASGVRREARPDDPDAGADVDQDRAAGEVGVEDDVAELLLVGKQAAHAVHVDLDQLAGVADDRGQVHARAGEQVEIAEEAVRPLDRDDPVLCAVALDDRDRAGLDDEEVVALVALAEQHLPRLDPPNLADLTQPVAMLVAQAGERAATVGRLLHPDTQDRAHLGALFRTRRLRFR